MAERETGSADAPVAATSWIDRDEPDWMVELRRKAYADFSKMSWPTPQEEEWRRTDVTMLDFSAFTFKAASAGERQGEPELPEGVAGLIRFSGRRLEQAVLRPELREKGVRLLSLSEAIRERNGVIEKAFRDSIEHATNRLHSWHYSQWTHGVFLSVPRFIEIAEPFILEFEESGKGEFSAPHVVVTLESGARAVVVQRLRGASVDEVLCNEGADLAVGEAAGLEFIRIQDLSYESRYFNHSTARIERNGTLKHLEVVFGSKLYKSRLEAAIVGPGADVDLNGIYFAHKRQHIDIGTIQRHDAPNANSRAFYKGAVRQKGRTIYRGLIEVAQPASQTDAYQTNKNLILNDGARSDSIPMLKINTNDVKCSHGSTTGKIDELQLFYLQTRGFSRVEAERMLITAFFDEVIHQAHASVQEELRATVQERLA